MSQLLSRRVALTGVSALVLSNLIGCANQTRQANMKPEIESIEISSGISLRRMIVRNPRPEGVVLLLHGFPETLYAWKDVSIALGGDYEVHAFDWPGYGRSSRPPPDEFAYAPKDYARVLKKYIAKTGIDKSQTIIYATDIGALPALLLALDDPGIARKIIFVDFAPFNRPEYMHANLQGLKAKPSSDLIRAAMNRNRGDILANAYRRGFAPDEQFDISREFSDDMFRGWEQNNLTSADAFYHYYSHFTRDQDYFELNLAKLRTPMQVIWGEEDFYIKKEMGLEFASRVNVQMTLLPGVGHYPHLQEPERTIQEIKEST